MRHGSLFSGIGGFDLAAEWMGWENVFHCEINKFCQKILKQHFPGSILYEDIKATDFSQWKGKIDIVSGGFPCQPYSIAGKRKGDADDRHLWPEMLRAIREVQPRWVVGENVPGLINWNGGMVFKEVQTDLENAGLEVFPPITIPACSVGADHLRYRVWIIAHAGGNGYQSGQFRNDRPQKGKSQSEGGKWQRIRYDIGGNGKSRDAANTDDQGLPFFGKPGGIPQKEGQARSGIERSNGMGSEWSWISGNVEPAICRRGHGISNRVDRIKALGNAVVPQVVYQIFKAIQQYEALTTHKG
jgi:DNA (cytosine-5)-methyltransferase 1